MAKQIKQPKLEQFRKQKEEMNKAAEEFFRKIQQADEYCQALKESYESLIRESVISGKDETAKLDKLSAEIEEAEKACARRRAEKQVFDTMRPLEKISSQDVVDSFNSEIMPAFKKQRIDPALDRLLKAKLEYANAVLNYRDVRREFDNLQDEARGELSQTYYYKLQDVELNRPEYERYHITATDLYDLESRQMPRSLEGVKA